MSELAARRCKPCEGGIAPLTAAEAQRLLAQISSAWRLMEDARAIRREFRFRDFYRTMSFVNALAHIAKSVSTPVATGERITGLEQFHRLFSLRACSVAQPDITLDEIAQV